MQINEEIVREIQEGSMSTLLSHLHDVSVAAACKRTAPERLDLSRGRVNRDRGPACMREKTATSPAALMYFKGLACDALRGC
jgi:hypothetical protein